MAPPPVQSTGKPAEAVAIEHASNPPLPPLVAKFPPPPGLKKDATAGAAAAEEKPEERKGFRFAVIGVGVLAVVALIGASVYLYIHFTAKPSPPPKPVATAAKPSATPAAQPPASGAVAPAGKPALPPPAPPAKPVAPPAVSALSAVPEGAAPAAQKPPVPAAPKTGYGKAVASARQATAAVKQNEVAPANEVVKAEAPAATKPAASTAAPAVAPASVTPAKAVPPAAVAGTEPPAAPADVTSENVPPPEPSVAFRTWVSNLKIVGVRAGNPARILIERTSYNQGDLVNPQLGVTFEGYDDQRRMVKFKDKTGATIERRDR